MPLSETEQTILDVESQRWKYPAAKEAHVFEALRLTPTRYYAALHRLLSSPEAAAYAPAVVNRLSRLRDRRRAVRSWESAYG